VSFLLPCLAFVASRPSAAILRSVRVVLNGKSLKVVRPVPFQVGSFVWRNSDAAAGLAASRRAIWGWRRGQKPIDFEIELT